MTRARILADYVSGGTTAAEFDYLDGVTSNVQTQLNAKVSNATHTGDVTGGTALTIADNAVSLAKMAGLARGKLIVGDSSGNPSALAVGSADEVLTHDGTDFDWAAAGGGGGGKVLQVLIGTNSTEAFTQSVTFATQSLTVSITPIATSSKIFIICNTSGYNNEGNTQVGFYTIYRDSTNLGPGNGYGNIYQGSGDGHDIGTNICLSELDSPSTTSAVTYGMYARVNDEGGGVPGGKAYWSMNQSKSTITVMEIGA